MRKTKAKKDKSSAKKKAGGYEISKEMLRDFQLESLEHLETCDAALIELDKNRKDKEAINNFFRAIHTIKGTAAYYTVVLFQPFLMELWLIVCYHKESTL